MKSRYLSIAVIIFFCLTTMPIVTFASSNITINTIPSTTPGSLITISGTSDSSEVIAKVLRPDDTVLFMDVLPVSAEGLYSTVMKLPSNTSLGTYNIIVGLDSDVAATSMTVNAAPNQVLPSTDTNPPQTSDPLPVIENGVLKVQLDESALTVNNLTENGHLQTNVVVDEDKLANAFKSLIEVSDTASIDTVKVIVVNVKRLEDSVKVELPIQALMWGLENVPDAIIAVQSATAYYHLPIQVLDMKMLAQKLGVSAENMTINVRIKQLSGDDDNVVKTAIKDVGATSLSTFIDFILTAESNGKKVELNNFGNTYIERVIIVPGSLDSDLATAVLVNSETGAISFVPAIFRSVGDGNTEVIIKRNGNSVYTVIKASKTFDDIDNHWGQQDIELLAAKLLVNGVTESSFAPDKRITRAEFTAMLVRALGLTPDRTDFALSDVKDSDWFYDAVEMAVKAKLIHGFNDGTFRPHVQITREEMSVMITRALTFVGKLANKSNNTDEILQKYKDSYSISGWARESMAQLISEEIMRGKTDHTIVPNGFASRAEAAAIVLRFLKYSQFIN